MAIHVCSHNSEEVSKSSTSPFGFLTLLLYHKNFLAVSHEKWMSSGRCTAPAVYPRQPTNICIPMTFSSGLSVNEFIYSKIRHLYSGYCCQTLGTVPQLGKRQAGGYSYNKSILKRVRAQMSPTLTSAQSYWSHTIGPAPQLSFLLPQDAEILLPHQ